MRALLAIALLSSQALAWDGESELVASLKAERDAVSIQEPLVLAGLAVGAGAAAAGLALTVPRGNGFEPGLAFTGNRNRDASMVLGCASVALFTVAVPWLAHRLWQRERVDALLR